MKNSDRVDTESFDLIKKIDKKAFEKLFSIYFRSLVLFANRFINDTSISENLVQDVFLTIWIRRNELDSEINIKSYLYTSVKNKALQHIRHLKVKERAKEHLQVHIKNHFSPEQAVIGKELNESLSLAVSELPEKCRLIFSMNRFDQLPYKEIAEILNISLKTVETQMGRALKQIRKRLAHFLTIFPHSL